MMALSRVHAPTVTDVIVEKIEAMIADGVYMPGEALLPERQLVKEFNVSRASLRAALSALEANGLIRCRQGGGNYICDITKNSFADPLLTLINHSNDLKFQLIELRQSLEASAAFYAAQRATDQDKIAIQTRLEELQAISGKNDPKKEAKAGFALHLAIADAAHNTPLTLLIRNVHAMLVTLIEEHLMLNKSNQQINTCLQNQYSTLVSAILAGDAIEARKITCDHLDYIRDLFGASARREKRNQNSEMRAYLSEE